MCAKFFRDLSCPVGRGGGVTVRLHSAGTVFFIVDSEATLF